MEGNQENMKKKNMTIKIVSGAGGGGGLAGILLLGGALATAALVSVFAFNRKQHKKINSTDKPQDNDLVGEGLSFLVPDSSSPQLNHQNSRADTRNESGSEQIMIMTENSQINGEKDEEIHLPDTRERTRDSPLCDESSISTEELLPEGEKAAKKNDSIEEVESSKVDEDTAVDINQVDVVQNDPEGPLDWKEVNIVCTGNRDIIAGLNKELVQTDLAGQTEVNGKVHPPGEECDGNGKTINEKKEILVEAAQSDQLGGDESFNTLMYGRVGNGTTIAENKVEDQTLVGQLRSDDNSQKGGNTCVDDGVVDVDKCEEFVEEIVAASGIQLSGKREAKTYRDQDIVCSDLNKEEFFIPVIDSSPKFGTDDLVEDLQVMKVDEAIEVAVQEDGVKLENGAQTHLIEAVEYDEESHSINRENTSEKCEEGDQRAAKDEQQMKPREDGDQIAVNDEQQIQPCQENSIIFINGDQEKYLSNALSSQSNSFKMQEFTFLQPGIPSFTNQNDSAETALHVEALEPMKNEGTADEVFADQIMLENKLLVHSSEDDKMEHCDNGNDNVVAKGALETGQAEETQKTKSDEAEDYNESINNDKEAVKTIQTEILEVEKSLLLPITEDNEYEDTAGRKDIPEVDKLQIQLSEEDKGEEDTDTDSDSDKEDNVHEVEGGSETTGDSSLESAADAIWAAESVSVQESSQKLKEMQANDQNFTEEDTDSDSDKEDNVHEVEGGSETTGDSSLESAADAIWAAESVSVQESSQKLKEMQANDQNFKEVDPFVNFNIHKQQEGNKDKCEMSFTKTSTTETAALKHPTTSFSTKIWLFSLLLPILLLVWLASSPSIVTMSE